MKRQITQISSDSLQLPEVSVTAASSATTRPLGIDLRCAGFLPSAGRRANPLSPGSAGSRYLNTAATRPGQLLDWEEGESPDIVRFFERQLTDQRQPVTPTGAPDPETDGLLAASYHAALMARK